MKGDEEMGRGGAVDDRRSRIGFFDNDDDDDDENRAVAGDGGYASSSSASMSAPESEDNSDAGESPDAAGDEMPLYPVSWPQSYRQSIDVFSTVAVPSPGSVGSLLKGSSFLGGSLLKGSSFLGGSFLKPEPTYVREEDDPSSSAAAALSKPLIAAGGTHVESSTGDGLPSPPPPRHSFSSFRDLPPSPRCSSAQAVANGLNVLCGVGLLSTPYAIKQGGWLGMLALFALGAISCYTGILLKKCLDSSPGLCSYPDIGQAAFGMPGRLFISVILYLELYSCCVEYITLVSDSLSYLFPETHMIFAGFDLNCHRLFAVTTAVLVLPTICLRNLMLLSYLSVCGVIASVVVVISLLWVGVVDGVGFHPSGTAMDLVNFPVALGLYGFCFSGHSVFPNIYSSMKKQSQFPMVLVLSFVVSIILYAGVAVTGFMMFGQSIKSQFTLNMPQQYVISKVAVWTTIVNPLSKYALTMTPVALSLEELFPSTQQSHVTVVAMRTALVLSTLVVALVIPFFGYVMALLGSFFTMLVSLILPCLCYLKLCRNVSKLEVLACVFIIFTGVSCAIIGSYTSIKQIIGELV